MASIPRQLLSKLVTEWQTIRDNAARDDGGGSGKNL